MGACLCPKLNERQELLPEVLKRFGMGKADHLVPLEPLHSRRALEGNFFDGGTVRLRLRIFCLAHSQGQEHCEHQPAERRKHALGSNGPGPQHAEKRVLEKFHGILRFSNGRVERRSRFWARLSLGSASPPPWN